MRTFLEQLDIRLTRWRSAAFPIFQALLAAALAWLIAVRLADNRSAFFAPISAILCVGITLAPQPRRGIELVAGVTIGIGVGELLISSIGRGPWQIALLAALALSAAILLDGGQVIKTQSAVSAVLVATGQTSGVSRMVDALIGCVLGLAVAALIPANPLTLIHRQADRVLRELAKVLRGIAKAIKEGDVGQAVEVLRQALDTHRFIDDFRAALQTAEVIATIAPLRWRCRPQLARYRKLAASSEDALRNTTVLIRRAAAALRHGDALPSTVSDAIARVAGAVDLLSAELVEGRDPVGARSDLRLAAASELIGEGGLSATVVLGQLRSTTIDLLQATGLTMDEALAALPSESAPPPATHETAAR